MVLSVPIAFALGISSVVTLIFTEKMPLNFIDQGMFTTVDSYFLIDIPLFTFVITFIFTENMTLYFIEQCMFITVDSSSLSAVTLFVFVGLIMEYGGLSRRLIDDAKSFVGHFTGGLAGVSIIACTIFAALS